MFKLIHDPSYHEQISGYSYIALKVLDENNVEVGQLKLEVEKDSSYKNTLGPFIRAKIHGPINLRFNTDVFSAE